MNSFELPHTWKYPGYLFIAIGGVLAIIYIWFDFRFSIPVFAVFSWFLEVKYLTSFSTNFSDETVLLLLVIGFFLVVFSCEKNQDHNQLKTNALWKALFLNTIIILFSILFIYGQGFFMMLVFNLFSVFLLYLVFFYIAKRKAKKLLTETDS